MIFMTHWMTGRKAITGASLIAAVALWAIFTPVSGWAGADEDLIAAAKRGALPEIKRLLDQGAQVNAKDKDEVTPLMLASENGRLDIVQTLLDKGADVNVKDSYGMSALMLASQQAGNLGVVQALLAKGADVQRPQTMLE